MRGVRARPPRGLKLMSSAMSRGLEINEHVKPIVGQYNIGQVGQAEEPPVEPSAPTEEEVKKGVKLGTVLAIGAAVVGGYFLFKKMK